MRSVVVQLALAFAAAGAAGAVQAADVTAATMDAVSEKSGHTQAGIAPDVAKTPTPGGPVPVPYPNVGEADKKAAKKKARAKVEVMKKNASAYKKSNGDEGAKKAKMEAIAIKQSGASPKPEGKPVILLTPIDAPRGAAPVALPSPLPPTGLPPAAGKADAHEYRRVNLEERRVSSHERPARDKPVLEPVAPVLPPRDGPMLPPMVTPIEKPTLQPVPLPSPVVALPPVRMEPVKAPQPIIVQPVQPKPVMLQPQPVLPMKR